MQINNQQIFYQASRINMPANDTTPQNTDIVIPVNAGQMVTVNGWGLYAGSTSNVLAFRFQSIDVVPSFFNMVVTSSPAIAAAGLDRLLSTSLGVPCNCRVSNFPGYYGILLTMVPTTKGTITLQGNRTTVAAGTCFIERGATFIATFF